MIDIKDISKVYELDSVRVDALKTISVNIVVGEFVSIMGPSGSGKSTLLHIIGCLDSPTSGSYRLLEKEVGNLSEYDLAKVRNVSLGFIFQTYDLLPRMSAIKNVELPMIYAGKSRKERLKTASEKLQLVGLADRINHRPSQLSGGQRQRVAIARSLVNNPAIILADEPTGNLDSKSGREIMLMLTELNKTGKTIIMVTHDKEIAGYGKRIIELKDGEIIKDANI